MPSVFSHAAVALSIGSCFYPAVSKQALAIGAVCSVIPDLDVIGFRFGIHYGDFLGHRGFTHSLLFASFLAGAATLLSFKRQANASNLLVVWIFFFLATASHGLLDAMTDGGLGVAFFAPFNNDRYFFPWTPVRVSPIGILPFFSMQGLLVFQSELVWIWVPAGLLAAGVWGLRRSRTAASS
jgi:inner membrane protein